MTSTTRCHPARDRRRVGHRRGPVRRGGHPHRRRGGTERHLPRAGRLGQPQRLPGQPPRVGTAHPARLGPRPERPRPAVRLPGRRDGLRHVAGDVQRGRRQFHLLRRRVAAAAALGLPGQDPRRRRRRLADQLRRPQALPRRGRRLHRRLRSRRRHRLPRRSRLPAAAAPAGQARHAKPPRPPTSSAGTGGRAPTRSPARRTRRSSSAAAGASASGAARRAPRPPST